MEICRATNNICLVCHSVLTVALRNCLLIDLTDADAEAQGDGRLRGHTGKPPAGDLNPEPFAWDSASFQAVALLLRPSDTVMSCRPLERGFTDSPGAGSHLASPAPSLGRAAQREPRGRPAASSLLLSRGAYAPSRREKREPCLGAHSKASQEGRSVFLLGRYGPSA